MNLSWSDAKEILFTIGSAAGVLALARPLVESKFQRDLARFDRIKELVREQSLVDLEHRVYGSRQVPDKDFEPFDQLAHELRTSQDGLRFSGPVASHFTREVTALLTAYSCLRKYVQVREWEPRTFSDDAGAQYTMWVFNREAFEGRDGIARDYAKHLDEAAEQALQMRKAFQRLQVVSEVHLYEVPIAGWLLKRRFAKYGLAT